MYHVGVDTGGTFTDFVALNAATGDIHTLKVPSVPADPAQAVRRGLTRLRERHGIEPHAIERFIFGTTVATNAILERKGGRAALVATGGTRDVIEIQRQWRHRLFDLALQKPEPLVPRRWRLEADERVAADGSVVTALGEDEAERVAARVAALDVESVAISLLFSFLHPDHERQLREALRRHAPALHVSLSSDVCPEFREYERTCTTVMNAYVMPKIHDLVQRLETELTAAGLPAVLRIIQSNGGLMSGAQARAHPVHTLLSGPAGGVVGAVAVAGAAGVLDVITIDMGGTSLDISLVQGGRLGLSPEGRLGGFPVKIPQVNTHTIGAGGGSIARLVRGTLKVGPESAGADPGPVCYGRGGTEPTSTDAAVVLGFIDPEYFLGGEIVLDRRAAEDAIRERLARPLGVSAVEAAMAIVQVQVANMVSGIRAVSVEQGLDPREFALLPFGGAGSLYAGLVAEEMGISRILAPVHPSVLSALGMLMTDVKYTQVLTRVLAARAADGDLLSRIYRDLEGRLAEAMRAEGIPPDRVRLERSCDMRYHGQAYEVNVPAPAGQDAGPLDVAALVGRFHEEHRRSYGQAAEREPVELVNFRVTGVGLVAKATLRRQAEGHAAEPPVPKREREAYFGSDHAWQRCPVIERAALAAGSELAGPALVEEPGATIVVYPGHRASVDAFGNLRVAVPLSSEGGSAPLPKPPPGTVARPSAALGTEPPDREARDRVMRKGRDGRERMTNAVDLVTLEVVGNYLVSAVREMGTTLMRTAYSTLIREEMDCSTALFDPLGQLIAQADHVPSHQGTLSLAAKTLLGTMTLEPGDVVILNHPYRGGTHHPDIMIFKPVFHEGALVALAGSLGHHLDVGGRSAGSISTDARDVFEEGLMIPPLKLYRRGVFFEEIFEIIASNIREPQKTLGDLRAQVAAVTVGERRVLELVERHGAKRLAAIVAACLDNSERLMREDLRAYPDGSYSAEGFMDSDGISDQPVRIFVTVVLRDGGVTVDFAGSSPQVRGPFNCALSSAYASVYCAVRYMVNPLILQNEGCYRPISVVLPEGSIVKPVPPAPLSGRFHTLERIANTIVMAFNQARGDQAVGSSHAHLSSFSVSGRHPANRAPYVFFEILGGGWGGTSAGDGLDATFGLMANCLDAPIEAVELEYPLRVERYEFRTDSGGAGRHRGGLGLRRDVRYLSGDGYFTNRSDAQKFPPPGVLGGRAGFPSRHRLVRADGTAIALPSKATNMTIGAGDLISLETAGGGGYGAPAEREPGLVLRDVLDGKVSTDAAREVYGVVVDLERGVVDAPATAVLRGRGRGPAA